MPRVIKVIELVKEHGDGTMESPIRLIRVYYSLDGEYLGQSPDPLALESCDTSSEET
jgi:hypothetical protein